MAPKELERFIHEQIPIAKAMGLTVTEANGELLKFRLPLQPNRNHQNTVFGGTLLSAQALIAWAWLTNHLKDEEPSAFVVIRRSQSRFLRPVDEDFDVIVAAPTPEVWRDFVKHLKEAGKARIKMECEAHCRGRKAVTFTGEYVAVLP